MIYQVTGLTLGVLVALGALSGVAAASVLLALAEHIGSQARRRR